MIKKNCQLSEKKCLFGKKINFAKMSHVGDFCLFFQPKTYKKFSNLKLPICPKSQTLFHKKIPQQDFFLKEFNFMLFFYHNHKQRTHSVDKFLRQAETKITDV